ncbi:MAG: hypothetical protein JWL71_1438 [Acidobacteria bacterium]|nr:hypothetical protein [Acidobacteriota bacterium]
MKVGAPTTVTELDLGTLKGELRQLAWSRDGSELYVQTADGTPSSEKLRHYLVPIAGGAAKSIDTEPEWAADYWGFKSDRFAPGLRSLVIGVEQKQEKVRVGTGSGRPGEQAGGAPGSTPVDIEKTTERQFENYARLTFAGETISEFLNQKPIPGLMFGWGPVGSGAMAYTDREAGHLTLIDQHKRKQTVPGVKDALLPAWSPDGARLAWVQKAGRRKYRLVWATVSSS